MHASSPHRHDWPTSEQVFGWVAAVTLAALALTARSLDVVAALAAFGSGAWLLREGPPE